MSSCISADFIVSKNADAVVVPGGIKYNATATDDNDVVNKAALDAAVGTLNMTESSFTVTWTLPYSSLPGTSTAQLLSFESYRILNIPVSISVTNSYSSATSNDMYGDFSHEAWMDTDGGYIITGNSVLNITWNGATSTGTTVWTGHFKMAIDAMMPGPVTRGKIYTDYLLPFSDAVNDITDLARELPPTLTTGNALIITGMLNFSWAIPGTSPPIIVQP